MKFPKFKDSYIEYVKSVLETLADQDFYNYFVANANRGISEINACNLNKIKHIDADWIERIEASIIALDTIVRNPRRFIAQEEDIVPISLAKKITQESVKHLAQHTNYIQEIKDGNVIPDKILNVSKEESYEIYENRFIYTLIVNTYNFIVRRLDQIEKDIKTSNVNTLTMKSDFNIENKQITYSLQIESAASIDDLINQNPLEMTLVERIVRIKKIFEDFINSAFGKQMRNCVVVRPPIQRTNVILKDPNFQNALGLWGFVESYSKLGYSMEIVENVGIVTQDYVDDLSHSMFLNYILFKQYVDKDVYKISKERTTILEPRFVKEFINRVISPEDVLIIDSPDKLIPEKQKQDKIRTNQINKLIDRSVDSYYKLKILEAQRIEELRLARIARLEKAKEARKAALAKKARERAALEKKKELEKARLAKEKEKALLLKQKELEKERLAKEKEKALLLKQKELEKERLAKEKAREAEKARLAKEKEKALLLKQKELEKERLAKEKAREAEKARLAKEKEKARLLKQKELEKARLAKEKAKEVSQLDETEKAAA